MIQPGTIHPFRTVGRAIRRSALIFVAATVLSTTALATDLVTRVPRAAAASPGTATSYGFVCSSNRWVRTNFPNMTAIGTSIESTWFRSDLYRWNASAARWDFVAARGWYAGASNRYGKLALGNLAGLPYYWLLNNGVIMDQGAVFNNLTPGYYRTAEYYQWQNGAKASRWSFVNGSGAAYCQIR